MPAQIPIESIIKRTLDGISKAQKDYEDWSGGDWVWNAPEYMLTTYIAQKLSKTQGAKFITLENGAKSALTSAGAIGKGKLHSKIRSNGRFDILLWWGNNSPRAVIEVKNQVECLHTIKKDLDRIKEVLKRKKNDSSFQFGLMAYYTSCCDNKKQSAEECLSNRIKNICEGARELLGDGFTISEHSKQIKTEDDSAWVSTLLLIKCK